MENLSDHQLEEVFRMCDSEEKGYITPTDLQVCQDIHRLSAILKEQVLS